MSDSIQTYDTKLALEKAGGNTDLAIELFAMLTADLADYATQIALHFQNEDIEQVRHLVHKLNGASSYCGVPALNTYASDFEKALNRQESEQYPQLLDRLIKEIRNVVETKDEFTV